MRRGQGDDTIRCLGIVDWGIGGLDLYKKIRQLPSDIAIIYLSDAGSKPYGLLAPEQLSERLKGIAAFFRRGGASHMVVACNAASSVITEELESEIALPIMGVIAPAIAALQQCKGASVVVLGGRATIASGIYQDTLRASVGSIEGIVAQPLSALVEEGVTVGPEVEEAIANLADATGRDILVPACTHYTALLPLLRKRYPCARVVDPSFETLRALQSEWKLQEASRSSKKPLTEQFFCTGNPLQMQKAAKAAFGVSLGVVQSLPLQLRKSV